MSVSDPGAGSQTGAGRAEAWNFKTSGPEGKTDLSRTFRDLKVPAPSAGDKWMG